MKLINKLKAKDENKEIEKAKKVLEEHAILEAQRAEQAKPTPEIETEGAGQKQQSVENTALFDYFTAKYASTFIPEELYPSMVDRIKLDLLFGIIGELKKINDKLEEA